jgi:GH24 family phage-related lysozyme (muramidase)
MNRKEVFDTLCIDEGVKYEIYADHLGYPTFGVGHLVTEDDDENGLPLGTKIEKERVWEAFEQDLDLAIAECHQLFPGDAFEVFPEEVQQIIVNMMFNMGRTRLSKFKKFIAALEVGDWAEAAVEGRDSRWHKQVTNRAERLMVRLEQV